MVKYKKVFPILVIFFMTLIFGGSCFSNPDDYVSDENESFVLQTLDPQGQVPVSYEIINLKEPQKEQLRQEDFSAALLFHTESDFSKAVVRGVSRVLDEAGISIAAVKFAEMDGKRQERQLEEVLALEPDVIIALVVDPVGSAAAFKKAAEKGIRLVFLSTLPEGFIHGRDYASLVSDDLFAMGNNVAEMIGEQLGGSGKVAFLYHDNPDYYVTNQRDQAVKTVLRLKYPEIEIVTEIGVNSQTDMRVLTRKLDEEYPGLYAIYVPWGTLAEDIIVELRQLGQIFIRVFTIDLGEYIALDMVRKGNIEGIVSDYPYLMGETLAKIAGLSLLNRKTPPFVVLPSVKINSANIEDRWREVLNEEIPNIIREHLYKGGVPPGLDPDE